MTPFQIYLRKGFERHGQKFEPPKGKDFIDAYNKGQDFRIKIVSELDGKQFWPRWGFVGVTTGWRPSFLLMKRAGQRGSSDLLNPNVDKVVDSRWLPVKKRRKL